MAGKNKGHYFRFHGWTLAASLSALVLLAWAVFFGLRARGDSNRCGPFLRPVQTRCCAPGQQLSAGRCVGIPDQCEPPFVLVERPVPGCALAPRKVLIKGGSVTLGPTDWDSADLVERHTVSVQSFSIDEGEVSIHEYQRCVRGGLCQALADGQEPGLPVTNLSVESASEFCAFRLGRLPTPAEWIFAASGKEARRFPWGAHGLVCRRAAYGLVDGPCAVGGISPELTGARTTGRSPEGILDLAGNVAEWTLSEDGKASVRGGSFRAKYAADLKVWSSGSARQSDDVGFRCVYPVKMPSASQKDK